MAGVGVAACGHRVPSAARRPPVAIVAGGVAGLTAYSYWRVGQYHTLRGYEAVRQHNVLFAGEHCSVEFQGYMEGGAAEGLRAANEVRRDLGA